MTIKLLHFLLHLLSSCAVKLGSELFSFVHLMIEVAEIFDLKIFFKNKWRLRHSYWTVLIRFHKGPKMLIWHCRDFVQLLDCNLDEIKTVITGPSRFMGSLIQSKAPSCVANGTRPFPPANILSFVSSADAKTFAAAVSKENRAFCYVYFLHSSRYGPLLGVGGVGLSVATRREVSPSRSNIFLTKWRIY